MILQKIKRCYSSITIKTVPGEKMYLQLVPGCAIHIKQFRVNMLHHYSIRFISKHMCNYCKC